MNGRWTSAPHEANCASCGGSIRRGERVFTVGKRQYAGLCATRAEARTTTYRNTIRR